MSEEKTSTPCPCEIKVVDGHLEADCFTKEQQQRMAELLEKEVIIRVRPAVQVEEPATPVTES